MELKSYREVGRDFNLSHVEVSAAVRIAGVQPLRLGTANGLTPEQIEQIRPALERLQRVDRPKKNSAVA